MADRIRALRAAAALAAAARDMDEPTVGRHALTRWSVGSRYDVCAMVTRLRGGMVPVDPDTYRPRHDATAPRDGHVPARALLARRGRGRPGTSGHLMPTRSA